MFFQDKYLELLLQMWLIGIDYHKYFESLMKFNVSSQVKIFKHSQEYKVFFLFIKNGSIELHSVSTVYNKDYNRFFFHININNFYNICFSNIKIILL